MTVLYLAPILVAMVIGATPCLAQSELSAPLEAVNEPIVMSYGELDTVNLAADISVVIFKGGQSMRSIKDRIGGTLSAHIVNGILELSVTGLSNLSITDNSISKSVSPTTCWIHKTGRLLACSPQAKVIYPLYERPNYKSGDTMKVPFVTVNGTEWIVDGKVRGKSKVGQRPVLVVDFAEERQGMMGASDIDAAVTGYAYLDLATGHPIQMQLTADVSGAFRDHDRVLMNLQLDYAMPGIEQ
jgi:hypothetical protein